MKRRYLFNNAVDMISLAREVQAKVYWNKHFIDKDDENVPYQNFWDYCDDAVQNEYDGVEITEDDEVTFIRTME